MAEQQSTQSTWHIAEAQRIGFEEPVTELHVRLVGGTVNVVAAAEAEGPARLEVTEVDGPPLYVVQEGGTLTVSYEDVPWNGTQGLKQWFDSKPWKAWSGAGAGGRKAWERRAAVTLTVPAATRVQVAVVDAVTFVSGISGGADVNAVSGDATLVGLTGRARAHTVSGSVEAQSVTGDLGFHSVSGGLTVVDGAGVSVRADSVSGDMLIDLNPGAADAPRPVDITLNSVSGQVAIRLPHPADARVEANTATGGVSNAFEDLRVSGQMGAKRITGTLGSGTGTLRATTVSGSIALLRRPPADADAPAAAPLMLDKKVL